MQNKYPGRCAACGARVEAGEGSTVKLGGSWAVLCSEHEAKAEQPRITFRLRDGQAFVIPEGYLGGDRFQAYLSATRAARCNFQPSSKGNLCDLQAAEALIAALEKAGLAVDVDAATRTAMAQAKAAPALPSGPRVRFSLREGKVFVVPDGFLGGDLFGAYLGATRSAGCKFEPTSKGNLCGYEAAGRLVTELKEAGFTVVVTEEVAAALAEYVSAVKQELRLAGVRLDEIDARLARSGMALYGYQREGVRWLSPRVSAVLADHPGLGKTVQVLASLPANAACVVVCPAVAKGVWRNELPKWRPDLRATVLSHRDSFRWPVAGEVVITNYAILPKGAWEKKGIESEPIPDPLAGTVIVADECQDLKGDSQRTHNFKRLSVLARKHGGRCWLLTGTPLSNTPPEVWRILSVAGAESEAFTSFFRFKKLFNAEDGTYGIEWGDPEPEVPSLLKRVMLRRVKQDVLPDLPEKIYQDIEVDIDEKYKREIGAVLKERGRTVDAVVDAIEEAMARTGSIPFEEYSHVRKILAHAKLPRALELIKDLEQAGEPLVVFSAHVWPLQQLVEEKRAEGKRWDLITGEVPPDKRTAIVAAFQAGKMDGVACSIKAAGTAITLHKSSTSVWIDSSWNPADNEQGEDRIHRIGQTRGVHIIRLVADHQIDRRVSELLDEKRRMIELTIEPVNVKPGESVKLAGVGVEEALGGVIVSGRGAAPAQIAPVQTAPVQTAPVQTAPVQTAPVAAPVAPSLAVLLAPHGPRTVRERWAAEALEELTALDPDHARSKNEMGFNSADGGTGRTLLARLHSEGLRPGEWITAVDISRKYWRQVGRLPAREPDDYRLRFEPDPSDPPAKKVRAPRKAKTVE